MSDRYPEGASNYSMQPRYPYPQSPPMGSLAAADSYAPSDWPAAEPALPMDQSGYDPFAAEKYVNPVVASAIESTARIPQRAFESSENMRMGGAYDPAPVVDAALLAMTGGVGGTGAGGVALGSGPIKAYHGSPHDFDKFDLSKIGTGEGAQAYGHGLYFADQEATAKAYRDALSSNVGNQQTATGAADRFVGQYGEGAADAIKREIATMRNQAQKLADAGRGIPQVFLDRIKNEYEPALEMINKGYKPGGKMYEVNINADPAHFLDWDKALSEMSPEVQKKLSDFSSHMSGAQINESARLVPGAYRDNRVAAENLAARGIPGIKYLDQGSRTAGEGSRNYVLFNDKLIDILRKYGLAGAAPAGMGALAAQDNYQSQ